MTREYGPKWKDLTEYLTRKYGIDGRDVNAMLFDIFRYIEVEVLRGGGVFRIPRFGRFERREIQHGDPLEPGEVVSSIVMRFTRKDIKRGGSYIDWEDDEWEEEEDEDE